MGQNYTFTNKEQTGLIRQGQRAEGIDIEILAGKEHLEDFEVAWMAGRDKK